MRIGNALLSTPFLPAQFPPTAIFRIKNILYQMASIHNLCHWQMKKDLAIHSHFIISLSHSSE
jgi:hypothetical protein